MLQMLIWRFSRCRTIVNTLLQEIEKPVGNKSDATIKEVQVRPDANITVSMFYTFCFLQADTKQLTDNLPWIGCYEGLRSIRPFCWIRIRSRRPRERDKQSYRRESRRSTAVSLLCILSYTLNCHYFLSVFVLYRYLLAGSAKSGNTSRKSMFTQTCPVDSQFRKGGVCNGPKLKVSLSRCEDLSFYSQGNIPVTSCLGLLSHQKVPQDRPGQ